MFKYLLKYSLMLLIFVMLLTLQKVAMAAPAAGKFGLGIVLFDPTGITAKYKLTNTQAIVGSLGWSRRGSHLNVEVLFDEISLAHKPSFDFSFYYGVGARLLAGDFRDRLGIRMPVGTNLLLRSTPIEFFGEIALILDLIPGTTLDLDLALGARYFF